MGNLITNLFFGVADRPRFFKGMQEALNSIDTRAAYVGDNVFTFLKSLGFLEDQEFIQAVERHRTDEVERGIMWRTHTLCWAARHAMKLEGDFVECGCYQGYTARVVADYVDFAKSGKTYWLYDVFEHDKAMPHHAMPNHSASLHERVKDRFSDLPSVHVIKGFVPQSFSQGMPEKVALLHIDMNNVDAEIGALDQLFDRVVAGGLIVFDDYGWLPYRAQMDAESAWLRQRNHMVLELPTGQGLVIKMP